MQCSKLAANLYVLEGAVNTGVLVHKGKALLFDCCDSVSEGDLARLGARSVEIILCTQHRRPNVSGAYPFVDRGARLMAPQGERRLFEDVEAYWNDWRNRWHLYHSQPGPQVLPRPIAVARYVRDGDRIEWEGFVVEALDTPGATDGAVSYLVSVGGNMFGFCGDVLSGPGQVFDLYSLQKGHDGIGDYHGFLGSRRRLLSSLRRLAGGEARVLVPAHGKPFGDPKAAVSLLEQRMETLWRNYTAGSALNYYFPALFEETKADPKRLTPAQTLDPPPWVRRVAYTSFAVISESGAALLIDCGHDTVVTTLEQWINEKGITSVEGCWVTHYHDDHVDALHRLPNAFGCPIMADEHLAEIIEHPRRFFLPCIAPSCAPAARKTRDRESWPWHEFQLTAFHFPGQTYYHGGLLVEGRGKKVFFAGDSGAPTGLDDYCGGNRTFLGPGRGFRRCLDIWRECKPDYIFNQHQDRPFRFSDGMLDAMEALLVEREQLVAEMVPWDDPNFAIDEWWVRTHPFEQDVCPEAVFAVDVQFTNHGIHPVEAAIEPVLPGGWRWHKSKGASCARVAARTDGAARAWIRVPRSASQGRYVIPFRVTWAGRYLGQFRHAIVVVC